MTHHMQYALATVDDVEAIRRLLRSVWLSTYKESLSPEVIKQVAEKWHSTEALVNQVIDPNSKFILAKNDDILLGLAHSIVESDTLHITKIYVAKKYQRQGIGNNLMKAMINAFPDIHRVRLEVEKFNQPAINFYQRLDFSIVGESQLNLADMTIDVVIMEKEL